MIVFNTNQLNQFIPNNYSQKKSNQFNLPADVNALQTSKNRLISVQGNTGKQDVKQSSFSIVLLNKSTQNFNQHFSSLAKYAITQYELFANIDQQQSTSTLLGINEYA